MDNLKPPPWVHTPRPPKETPPDTQVQTRLLMTLDHQGNIIPPKPQPPALDNAQIEKHDAFAQDIFTSLGVFQCPKCKEPLSFFSLRSDIFPYIHVDMKLRCYHCDLIFIFGVPTDKLAGLMFYTLGASPAEAARALELAQAPICPFHNLKMKATKYWTSNPDADYSGTVQFKCPECFHIRHKRINFPTE